MSLPDLACRTLLAVPAGSARMVARARALSADALFLDLEDSVAAAAKDEARGNAVEALQSGPWAARRRLVRINDLRTPWAYRDVIALVEGAGENLGGILLPKATGPEDVRWLDTLLHQLELAVGLPPGGIAIDALIEDAAGLCHADAIAGASARVRSLVFGPLDFAADLGIRTASGSDASAGEAYAAARRYALLRVLSAARSTGRQAIDGPWPAVKDAEGLRREAGFAAALGFDGKMVLHPDQIPVVNDAFTPTAEERARAAAVLEACGQAGAVLLDGEMVDEASRKWAEAVLARCDGGGL